MSFKVKKFDRVSISCCSHTYGTDLCPGSGSVSVCGLCGAIVHVYLCVFPLYSFYRAKLQVSHSYKICPIAIASRVFALGILRRSEANQPSGDWYLPGAYVSIHSQCTILPGLSYKPLGPQH